MLRLLGTDLDGPEIARELIVSLNTVRTHTKHIYAKLGVNNRRAAVAGPGSSTCCREPATASSQRHLARSSPHVVMALITLPPSFRAEGGP